MRNRWILALALCLLAMMAAFQCGAADVPLTGASADFGHGDLKVSSNGRYLVHSDGTPFFFLGDTAWELFHRLNLQETDRYLENRRMKGFTVIQAVVLNEFDALLDPNRNGDMLFIDNDLSRPNEAYFRHIDNVVDKAAEKGMAIGMLPVWGDKVGPVMSWGLGPEKFVNVSNAKAYGRYLGTRYKDRPNIIWILGGDRSPKGFEPVWRELAAGLKEGDGGRHLMSYHPGGWASSSDLLHKEPWLDFNMIQSSHGARNQDNASKVTADYRRTPVKPCLDAEPPYEDHPIGWDPAKGWFDDYDVRQAAYWAVFAGAFGHTYGCHDIWQFLTPDRKPVSSARTLWTDALDLPGSWDMKHLRSLMESRPYLARVPNQAVIAKGKGTGGDSAKGTKGEDYLMVYVPTGKPFTVNLIGTVSGDVVRAFWFDPREGTSTLIGDFPNGVNLDLTPPTMGRGNDWVLVVDDASKGYQPPGETRLGR